MAAKKRTQKEQQKLRRELKKLRVGQIYKMEDKAEIICIEKGQYCYVKGAVLEEFNTLDELMKYLKP